MDLAKQLFRRRTVSDLRADALEDNRLKRALGPLNLTTLGIGGIIGTGIFVLTGTVAAQNAGPAVVISFIIAGLASVFAALCYSEFASLVPVAGSAYTYAYATLGEFFAWVIGWDLILEYALGALTVSIGWSGYVVSFLRDCNIHIPLQMTAAYGTIFVDVPGEGWKVLAEPLISHLKSTGMNPDTLPHIKAIFNLPAMVISFIITTLLVIGIRESANVNNVIVIIKVAVILVFIGGGIWAIKAANWQPFIPENTGKFGNFGWSGVLAGAGTVFFAYIGFDAVSTAAQEAKNPQRDMPIGIIGSLLICTVLYILVSAVATGVVSYKLLNVPDPIAVAADSAGLKWMAWLIKLGAIAGLSSVILVLMLGQTRVLFSMAREGLLPDFFCRTHPRFHTPWLSTILTGGFVGILSAFFTVREAGDLVSIGTLLAFVLVCIAVLELRIREPNLPRTFKAPAIYFVAPAGAISAFILMLALPLKTWMRLIVWLCLGLLIYFGYSIRHSKLAKENSKAE